jgi:YidC/Oxa1 family membrane protein insertase
MPAESPQAVPAATETTVRKAVVDTPLYRAEFSNQGAVLTSFLLKKYKNDFDNPLEMVPQGGDVKLYPLSLEAEDKSIAGKAATAIFALDKESLTLKGSESGTINFSYSDGRLSFHKTVTFKAESYVLGIKFDAMDGTNPLPVRILWSPGLEDFSSYKNRNDLRPTQGLVDTGEKVDRQAAKKVEGFQKVGASVRWGGLENSYFAAIFIPSNPSDAYLSQVGGDDKVIHNLTFSLAAQKAGPQSVDVFVGPKDYLILKDLGMDLEHAVDFGFYLAPIVKALFFGLRKLFTYTNNYGWAIVILTVLIKLIFTPFMQKSFASQKKMQAMQPEMKQIQDKYAKMKNDDPRKAQMNTEIMALHKRFGVNPLGGCLPMLVQMPVLIGFYRLLSSAIELRHAPFLLWITDLSKPDPLYITPVLMGASMLVQQRMTPVTDPMQKNMMYIMPVMFTFMSFKLQSGLVLYWLLSNLLGLLHQYLFQWQQKRTAREVAK